MTAPAFVLTSAEQLSYAGIALLMMLGGYAIPFPEEVILLLIGYLTATNMLSLPGAVIACLAGTMAGDSIIYTLSAKGSHALDRLKRRLSRRLLARAEAHMRAHIGKTLFGLRFIIGLRFFSPFLAGSMKIPWRTFLFFDTLALIIYVPLFVFIGYHFHTTLAKVLEGVTYYRHVVTVILIILSGLVVSVWVSRVFLRNGETDRTERS